MQEDVRACERMLEVARGGGRLGEAGRGWERLGEGGGIGFETLTCYLYWESYRKYNSPDHL